MPEGPLGGPRPFSSDTLHREPVFTGQVISGNRVTVPKWLRDDIGVTRRQLIELQLFPLYDGVLDANTFRTFSSHTDDRNRITIPGNIIEDLSIHQGMGVLIWIREDEVSGWRSPNIGRLFQR